MALLAEIREGPQADIVDGFRHISGPVSRVVDRVAYASIRRALSEGDIAKAERLRCHWWSSKEGRADGA